MAVFHGGEDHRSHAIHFREFIEIGEHAAGVLVAIVENLFGELLVTITGIDGKEQGIFFVEDCRERGGRRGIEIGLAGSRNAVVGVQRAQHFFPAGLESQLVLAFAFHEDQHFIGIGIADVLNALDFRVAETLRRQAAPELVHIRRLGKADIHVGATLEIDPVANATAEENGGPPSEEKNTA